MTDTGDAATAFGQYADLEGKSVSIIGGGSGIGVAITVAFIAQGAKAAFAQRSNTHAFCATVKERQGEEHTFIPCDITDGAALKSAMALPAAVNVLVNNAANDQRHQTLEVNEAFWVASMAINLKGVVTLTSWP